MTKSRPRKLIYWLVILSSILLVSIIGLQLAGQNLRPFPASLSPTPPPTREISLSITEQPPPTPSPTATAPVSSPAATASPAPTQTATPTPTPTPTLDLSTCNAAGCGLAARPLPTLEPKFELFLAQQPHSRRSCPDCPKNEQLSEAELDQLLRADPATLAQLRAIVLSQQPYEIAPGIIFIVYDYVYHVIIDLNESGYILRNVIPHAERGTLITPSYCYTPNSLVVIDADYHGLNGSNKTETGRDLFFHLGRAALFQREGRFDIDVIRTRPAYDRTSISWGGGPIFLWDGRYDYNPEQEWFDKENLEHYRTTRWAKVTAAVTQNRKYLFLSASYGLTLKEHAQNLINLGQTWGMKVDRAMRFDGSENAYLAIRLDGKMVPIFDLAEPLIVNCLTVERSRTMASSEE